MLTMPTRELVGLLADVHPFASPDDEDTAWHRVVLRWDGSRLHAMAGTPVRMAWMSWGPQDGDQPTIPGLDYFDGLGDSSWELAIRPGDAKEIATKFKLSPKEGEAPLRVLGSADSLRVERDADSGGGVALTSSALSRPWDDAAPRIDEAIGHFERQASEADPRRSVAYAGPLLADFCNPKVVRQRDVIVLTFGSTATVVRIGSWFRGVVVQAEEVARRV